MPTPDPEKKPLDPREIESKLKGLRGDQLDALWRIYSASEGRLSQIEKSNRRELVTLFRGATEDILKDVNKVFAQVEGNVWDYRSMRRLQRDKVLFDQIKDRLKNLGVDLKDSTQSALDSAFRQTWADNAYLMDTITPPSSSIQFSMLPDTEIVALLKEPFMGANFSDRLGHITDEMADKIKHELIRSMMAEETWSQAAKRIRGEMGTQGRKAMWRADMIARTELTRATEIAAKEFNDSNQDLIDKVLWVAHPGACELCQDLNGTEIKNAEDYPPLHPHCRCRSIAVPVPWEDLSTSDKENDAPVKQPAFATWAKDKDLEVGGTD